MVRHVLGDFAEHLGMVEPTVGDLKTVVNEACALAVGGAAGEPRSRPVRVEAECDGADLTVVVHDRGSRLRLLESGDGEEPTLGLKLIAALSSFEISDLPEGGTAVSMRLPLH